MQNPPGAQPPALPVWEAWQEDSSAKELARLHEELEPGSGGRSFEDDWGEAMASGDDWDSFTRRLRQYAADKEARALWGPQPPATAQQLAAALVAAVAKGGPFLHDAACVLQQLWGRLWCKGCLVACIIFAPLHAITSAPCLLCRGPYG